MWSSLTGRFRVMLNQPLSLPMTTFGGPVVTGIFGEVDRIFFLRHV